MKITKIFLIISLVLLFYVPFYGQESKDESWLRGTWKFSYYAEGIKHIDTIKMMAVLENGKIYCVDSRGTPLFGYINRDVVIINSGLFSGEFSYYLLESVSWVFIRGSKHGIKYYNSVNLYCPEIKNKYKFRKVKVKKVKQ